MIAQISYCAQWAIISQRLLKFTINYVNFRLSKLPIRVVQNDKKKKSTGL